MPLRLTELYCRDMDFAQSDSSGGDNQGYRPARVASP